MRVPLLPAIALSSLRLGAIAVVIGATFAVPARAQSGDDSTALFSAGTAALRDGRAADAIASFEALADRGIVDPALSYDRGLAYAMRVRIGAEMSGDLGRAAHGFEEARDLTRDSRLADDAARGLAVVRSEVARRKVRAGEPVEVDPARSLARTLAGLLPEDAWSAIAAASSAILGLGLFVRWMANARRARIGGGVAAGVAGPALVIAIGMTLAARHDRMHLREAVLVVANARPTDEHGIATPGAMALPEGARVEIVDTRGAWSRVRFGSKDLWIASTALRPLARAD
jgi:hypothetical protein